MELGVLPTLLARVEECRTAGNRCPCGSRRMGVPWGGVQARSAPLAEREREGSPPPPPCRTRRDEGGRCWTKREWRVSTRGDHQGAAEAWGGLRYPRLQPRGFDPSRFCKEGTQFGETKSGLKHRGPSLQWPKSLWSTSEGPQDDSVCVL